MDCSDITIELDSDTTDINEKLQEMDDAFYDSLSQFEHCSESSSSSSSSSGGGGGSAGGGGSGSSADSASSSSGGGTEMGLKCKVRLNLARQVRVRDIGHRKS